MVTLQTMSDGTLTIYSASAGSGKTFRLAEIYLEKLFSSRFAYRRILAVTFTNKATAEMKSRILSELNNLASGADSKHLAELMRSTGKSEDFIRKEAGEILNCILHDFSRFYISTIDSFFQKILRAFARDIGVNSGFSIEIDHSQILAEAVDRLLASVASDGNVRRWLGDFIRSNIEDEKSWDLRNSILRLSEEIFREKFKLLSREEKTRLQDKDLLLSYIKEMKAIKNGFKNRLQELGNECLSIFDLYSLTDEMFYYKGSGVPGFIKSLSRGIIKEPNKHVRSIDQEVPKWSTGIITAQLAEAVSAGLGSALIEAIRYYDAKIYNYNTANLILSNIYALGILTDVLNYVRQITADDNLFLLSDTGELIYLITEKDQTPFIYEKVGNIFENFMIDEFQDTSTIQWNNFSHLIDNSMAQGGDNLVVGDIKQSIYRWRNSNWITLDRLKEKADDKRLISKPLNTNWRSCRNIIKFNNELFSIIPKQLDLEDEKDDDRIKFTELYSEANQDDPGNKNSGFVRIEFIGNNDIHWREQVLGKIPEIIEYLQDNGYRASNIGILVRSNSEGADVLKYIIDYSTGCPAEKKERYNYNVISADSLLLSNSPVVNFLLSILSNIDDPSDMINRAVMLRYYLLAQGRIDSDKISISEVNLKKVTTKYFPEGFEEFMNSLKSMTLWDITERATGFFRLGDFPFNVPYLNSFQDIIVNYTSGKKQDVRSFLDWWATEGINKSIALPEQQDSMQVMTIHKSKGLEFEVVILPFISWNLDHKAFQTNILWIRPGSEPFNRLPIVPVRYKKDLEASLFRHNYYEEKYSAYIDNLNLLYVAMTRAKNAIYGFAPDKPGIDNRIAVVLKNAISASDILPDGSLPVLSRNYNPDTRIFQYGELPPAGESGKRTSELKITTYPVSFNLEPLKLRLHWEDYFRDDQTKAASMVSYGKLMHEVFSEIATAEDVQEVVRRMVMEGKVPPGEETNLCGKIIKLIEDPAVSDWFDNRNEVLNEATIVIPGSEIRRPDRIIIRDGRVTVIDFKFGDEHPHHRWQISQYWKLLSDMGYTEIKAFLWYVDAEKIVEV